MEFERRQVKGWRTRLQEEEGALQRRVWDAPSHAVHHPGTASADGDHLLGHTPWFRIVYGPERAVARNDLAAFRAEQRRLQREQETPDEREARRAAWREQYARRSPQQIQRTKEGVRARIAGRSAEQRATELLKRRERDRRRAARERDMRSTETDEERDERRAGYRLRAASRSAEQVQREKEAARRRVAGRSEDRKAEAREQRRRWRDANRDQVNANDRRTASLRRGEHNARKRAAYAQDPEHFRSKERAYRAAHQDKVRAQYRERYARKRERVQAEGNSKRRKAEATTKSVESRTQAQKQKRQRTPEQLEKIRLWFRKWHASRPLEWHQEENRKRRERVAINPAPYKANQARSRAKLRDVRCERRREQRIENIEEVRAKARAYYQANKERLNAYKHARRAERREKGLPVQ